MTARKQTERQLLIKFVRFLNKERVCGCVQLIPESVVNCFYWSEFDKEAKRQLKKNDLNEGLKF